MVVLVNKDRILDNFLTLVKIDSVSGKEGAVRISYANN